MKSALAVLLEPKYAKKAVRDCNSAFEFYLQMQVLMYAKIAMIHGFDLGIDSPIAPKELIEIKPLENYEDPYDFMKEFDYNKPYQAWIDLIHQRTEEAEKKRQEEAEKNKPFWKRWFS